jgi:hypothetical protein
MFLSQRAEHTKQDWLEAKKEIISLRESLSVAIEALQNVKTGMDYVSKSIPETEFELQHRLVVQTVNLALAKIGEL